jgi:hypothetical protein
MPFEHVRARGRREKREAGGPGQGCHAARERARGLPPTSGRRPDRVPADHGPALAQAGSAGSLTRGTRPATGEGGRRERDGARVGRPGKERGGPSPDEQ